MLQKYKTVVLEGTDEIVEKKSRFIGYIRHVESEEEAVSFVMEIKKKHYDARHNCYAYIVGQEQPLLRFSDDGEPSGTAGKPILEVISKTGLFDVCIVVTRYFGGTLLGTGGLVRAYTDAAKACIQKTEIIGKKLIFPTVLTVSYNDLGKIQHLLNSEKLIMLESEYGENVEIKTEIPFDDYERIEKLFVEATSARIDIQKEEAKYSVC